MLKTASLLLAGLTGLTSLSAAAGVVLKVDLKDGSGKRVPNEIYYAQNGMMRIDSLDARGRPTRIDLVRDGVIWELDPRQRSFVRIDAAGVGQLYGGRMAKMDAALASLPPDKLALMQSRFAQMKQEAADTHYAFSDTGRSGLGGSYACEVWREERNGKPFAEYCVVSASALPAGAELEAAVKKSVATLEQVASGAPEVAYQAEHLTRLGKLGGFPASWHFESATDEEHVLASAESQSLPEDKFAIPQGYTQKSFGAGEGD